MKTKSIHWGLLVLMLTAWTLPAAARTATTSATGTIGSLSPATRTVILQKSDNTQVMLRVSERAVLTRNGKPVRFGDLALRDQATAQIQGTTLVRLDAQGPVLDSTRGVFAGFDASSNLLTLATLGGTRSFHLAASTLIVRNGAPATAQGLAKGDALLVHSPPLAAGAPSGTVATAADVIADGPEEEEVEGTITALSGKDVTITPAHGSAVTVHVSSSTVIKVIDASGAHTATLADLATGMAAAADYDPVSLVADHILARAAQHQQAAVEGKVSAVDATAGTISITPEHGGTDVALHVGASTRISRNGTVATLADIKVGDAAEALYDVTTKLALRIDARGERPQPLSQVEGTVTAVTGTSLTITPEHGGPVTLKVDASTRYVLDGAAATLADVKVGQRAHASYDRTTSLAAVVLLQNVTPPTALAVIQGRVTAVSATSITIAPEHGSPVTLVIDSSTVITRRGRTATAADVHAGDHAEALYVPATLLAKRIETEAAEGSGHH
ncbi:MAG TPA: DUF5666 domain-containing protein [Thermoanaerobaculia bacterium]|jgi:hypothetical protein|nr:DUF5666 domain-containing protein [Thermoanaerobaculia bacterium]